MNIRPVRWLNLDLASQVWQKALSYLMLETFKQKYTSRQVCNIYLCHLVHSLILEITHVCDSANNDNSGLFVKACITFLRQSYHKPRGNYFFSFHSLIRNVIQIISSPDLFYPWLVPFYTIECVCGSCQPNLSIHRYYTTSILLRDIWTQSSVCVYLNRRYIDPCEMLYQLIFGLFASLSYSPFFFFKKKKNISLLCLSSKRPFIPSDLTLPGIVCCINHTYLKCNDSHFFFF
jgi:hypothetical protein